MKIKIVEFGDLRMSIEGMPPKTKEALDWMGANNLYAYNVERLSEFTAGLSVVLNQELPIGIFRQNSPVPIAWVEKLLETCKNMRTRLVELNVSPDHGAHQTLDRIISNIDWHFGSHFISQEVIDQERFNHKIYQLLRELGLIENHAILGGSWGFTNQEEIERQKIERRQKTLEVVQDSPVEVIKAVFSWAKDGLWHNAIQHNEREKLFKFFELIEHEKRTIEARNAQTSSLIGPN